MNGIISRKFLEIFFICINLQFFKILSRSVKLTLRYVDVITK